MAVLAASMSRIATAQAGHDSRADRRRLCLSGGRPPPLVGVGALRYARASGNPAPTRPQFERQILGARRSAHDQPPTGCPRPAIAWPIRRAADWVWLGPAGRRRRERY